MRKAADNATSNGQCHASIDGLRVSDRIPGPGLDPGSRNLPIGYPRAGGTAAGGIIYYGEATVDGEPVPDGHTIVGRVGDYESKPRYCV